MQTKISLLPTKSTVDSADYIPIVDVSTNTTRKITKSTLATSLVSATGGWNTLGYNPSYASNNGSKEFTCTVGGSVDLTSIIAAGMKVQFTRNVTAPTQCMSFTAASSQYATKTSPAGYSFTTAFTIEAWVKLNSYPSGNAGVSGASVPGTSGFLMHIDSSGRLTCYTVATQQVSVQAVPLGRWTHLAVTYAAGTMITYINGVAVASNKTGSGSSFTQGGPLQVGAYNSTNFLDGLIAEVRIWSSARTASNIQDNMAISLTGSESGLVSLFQGNGNFNDKNTTNANNLTATNGAIATQTNNPYNNIEYGIITKVAYSAPNTTITVFTGTDYNLPNMALTNVQYSTSRSPYGFASGREKWAVEIPILNSAGIVAGAASSWQQFAGSDGLIPTGSWRIRYSMITTGQVVTTGSGQAYAIQLSPSGVTPISDTTWSETQCYQWAGAATGGGGFLVGHCQGETTTLLTTATTLKVWAIHVTAPGGSSNIFMERGPAFIRADCGYL